MLLQLSKAVTVNTLLKNVDILLAKVGQFFFNVESTYEIPDLYMHFSLFGLMFYIPVNSFGHVETVNSPNHTFSWASLTKQLTSTLCTYFCL